MLTLPRLGCINLHGSLLPKYRGAAPIQWAVANGDAVTGNTTMLIDEGLDTGPILLVETRAIGPDETSVKLFDQLAKAGAPLVVETLRGLADRSIEPRKQNDDEATFAPLLNREDGRMDFTARAAHELYNRWRGFQPWPGAFTALDGKKLIVHRMKPSPERDEVGEPGKIVADGSRMFVACAGNTWLELVEVQLEGKRRVTAAEFMRGVGMGIASHESLG
jgi:methionyl-tRNA formyltransferase